MKEGAPMTLRFGILLITCVSIAALAQEHQDHYDAVNKRGESHQGMGFSQTETTHHFLLTESGGIIQVTANKPGDSESVQQIQQHFQHIAQLFSKGDFNIPHFVHSQNPPGVPTMKREQKEIRYKPELLENGARIAISSKSPKAIEAIHQFLRFQIQDHRTGDPGTVETVQSK
jgi:hypothetical protein